MIIPRDYQEYGINSVFEYFAEASGNPLLLYPTGTGKSVVIAEIFRRALQGWPSFRGMMITHSELLVEQNYEKLKAVWPEVPAGIYCAGLNRKEHFFPITFCSIQSVANVTELFGFIDFIVVDEAHMISPSEETLYQKVFTELRKRNPKLKIVGLTATGFRMKQGHLLEGENAIFTDVIVDATNLEAFNWFLDEGFLVAPIPKPTREQIDTSKVKFTAGDYNQKELQEVSDTPKINEAAVREILMEGAERNCGLIFATGVDHCKHLHEVFEYYVPGEATWVASRGMTGKERDRRISDFKAGKYRWMINNGILTTGFDHPPVDLIAILRKMMSPGLWVQILGRGTRPLYEEGFDLSTKEGRLLSIAASAKQNTLVLDFCGNTAQLGPINDPVMPNPRKRNTPGDAPVRICDNCGCYNHASATECWMCHHIFPRQNKVQDVASTKELVRRAKELVLPIVDIVPVDRVVYNVHTKTGRPDSIKVMYHCGVRMFTEWVCLEHGGYAAKKAREWWRERMNDEPPETTADAIAQVDALRIPTAIKVVTNMPNGEISGYVY